MAKFNEHKSSFLAGEWGPRALGRTDLDAYIHSAQDLLNSRVFSEGGAGRRCGTQYIKTAQGSSGKAFLLPFVYAVPSPDALTTPEVYVVEFTNGAIRVIDTYSGNVITPSMPAGYHTATAYSTYPDVLERLQFAQSADVMWLFLPSRKPQKLIRTAYQAFDLKPYDWTASVTYDSLVVKNYPFFPANTTATTIALNNVANTVNTTVTMTSSTALFDSNHVGAFFKLTKAGKTGAVRITAYVSATQVTGKIWNELEATLMNSNTTNWEECAWSDFRGWPRACTFFEGGLWAGGTSSKRDTFWRTKVSNYDHWMAAHFAQDTSADVSGINYSGAYVNTDPVAFTLSARQVNEMQWMDSKRSLLMGTSGSEYDALGPDQTQAIGALNITTRENSTHGSLLGQPSKVGTGIVFASKDGKSLREMRYDLIEDVNKAENILEYSSHLVDKGGVDGTPGYIWQTAWQDSQCTLWSRTTNGYLFGLTRNQKTGVSAPFPVELGGTGLSSGQPPFVSGMCVVPSTNNAGDDLWLAVGRVINGSTIYYIERMQAEWRWAELTNWTQYADQYNRGLPVFSDCAKYFETTKSISAATAANPVVITSNAHGYVNGDRVRITGVLGMTQLNGNVYTVANKTANTFELSGTDGSAYTAYSALGTIRKLISTATGMTHLVGATVAVQADGYFFNDKVVDGSGNVDLGASYSTVIVGLPFTNRMKLPKIKDGSTLGSSRGLVKRISRTAIEFFKTQYCKMGTSEDNLQAINFNPADLAPGNPTPLFTGEKSEVVPSSPDRDQSLILECDMPVPMHVCSVTLKGETSDQ